MFGRIHRCVRGRTPVAHLAGRAENGAAIYVIPGRETPTVRRSTPDYIPPDAEYVPWPHGQEAPAEHRRRRVSPRVRALILVLVGAVIAFLALGAVAALADDPEPEPQTPPRPAISAPPSEVPQTPPAAPDDELALAGDIVWVRRA